MSCQITMVLPGLLDRQALLQMQLWQADKGPGLHPGAVLEALEWWLTLAEPIQLPGDSPADIVWQQSGFQGCAPVAALSYFNDFGEKPPGPVVRADPVYLAADRDCVRLQGIDLESFSIDEAKQLADEINQQFTDEPWRVIVGAAQRWYLLLENAPDFESVSPQQAWGQNMHDYLPSGADSQYWRKILNEIQMLMFSSVVNRHRETNGMVPANSVWLWGEGTLPEPVHLPWDSVYSDDSMVCGLAQWASCAVEPAPKSASDLLGDQSLSGQILCQPTLNTERPILVQFNEEWIMPLYTLLQHRNPGSDALCQLSAAELWVNNGVAYKLISGRRRWWRRRRSIEDVIA